MSVNKVILLGLVGQDPKIMTTKDGREIANFSLATSESWKNKQGEKQQKTEWHKVVVFSQGLVGIVKSYVNKGSKLYLEGQLQTRKYTDKDGVEKYATEVVLQNYNSTLQLLSSKGDKPAQEMSKHDGDVLDQVANNATFEDELDDSIPF